MSTNPLKKIAAALSEREHVQGLVPQATPGQRAQALDTLGELLRADPQARAALEQAYAQLEQAAPVIEADTLSGPGTWAVNAKQAAVAMAARTAAEPVAADEATRTKRAALAELETRILAQLLAVPADGVMPHAQMLTSTGQSAQLALIGAEPVDSEEVARFGAEAPDLTATAARCDIGTDAAVMVGVHVERMRAQLRRGELEAAQRSAMHVLQGLMVLDLEPATYLLLGQNPASMGHWLPELQHAAAATGFFRIPETTVVTVPLTILQMSRLEYSSLTPATLRIVDAWAMEAFGLDTSKDYFVKTGLHSSKFDFRNAHIAAGTEVTELGQYLLYLTHQAVQMASPDVHGTGKPVIVGMGETNEWVAREWIADASGAPTIYHGMPLRTELRAFIDADTDEVLGVVDYWNEEVMRERFSSFADRDDLHTLHDAAVWAMHAPVLAERCERFRPVVERELARLLPHLGLKGQWSLDVMVNDVEGEQMYLIDMAPAGTSALTEQLDPQAQAKLARLGGPGHWLQSLAR